MFGSRKISNVSKALLGPQHYWAGLNMFRRYEDPFGGYSRYLFGKGDYPADVVVKTPTGQQSIHLYSHDDMLTVNEIFCRDDYYCSSGESVFVDFGANIGLSALYFLTRGNPDAFVHLFEPVPTNVAQLKRQLADFVGHFEIHEAAIGLEDGSVSFGIERSGRYGGITGDHAERITVRCENANGALERILARHGKIDVLKVDIEGFEQTVIENLPPPLAADIGVIYAEWAFAGRPLAQTHVYRQRGSIAIFRRLSAAA